MDCKEHENGSETAENFTWSELPPMPVFSQKDGDETSGEDTGKRRFLSRRIKRILFQATAVLIEASILAAVIGGVYAWQKKEHMSSVSEQENIVYSSDDIVMMLTKQRDDWILEKPDEGYTSCCFLDMDFDGSPELMSIAYDRETSKTNVKIYRVRNCILDEIEVLMLDDSGFFDVSQQLSLCYSPDTKEMLYISENICIAEDYRFDGAGSFFVHENQVREQYYFRETLTDGVITYELFDEEGTPYSVLRQDYYDAQYAFSAKLTDLKLQYEWVQSGGDLSKLSSQKLAALLLRSYDSFHYDTSGLALQ